MVRQAIFDAYGEESYSRGLTVYTTIRKADQDAAYNAVRRGVLDYDRRHGYRGPEGYVSLPSDPAELEQALDRAFQELSDSDNLEAAIVLAASPAEVKAVRSDGETVSVSGDGLKFAARALSDKASPASRIRRGAVIRVSRDDKGRWQIAQLPQVESAFDLGPAVGRCDPLAGRRLRLRPQQVQPRDPGAEAAGIELQAVHLFGRARKRLQSGDGRQRRAAVLRCLANRERALGAEELRRQVRRARCACAPP